jgi:predicted amidophosphoribosyltransferase
VARVPIWFEPLSPPIADRTQEAIVAVETLNRWTSRDMPEESPNRVTVLRPWRESLISIEREWLGLRSAPLDVRLGDAGWTPEPAGHACPRCARSVGAFGADASGCADCRSHRPPWDRIVRLGPYQGILGEIVREIKFERFRSLGVQTGRLLGDKLRIAMMEAQLDPRQAAIVPVPMSRRRYLERGIDHTLVISRGIRQATGARIVRILSRSHGPSQLAVPASSRRENVSGVFRTRSRIRPAGKPAVYIVVDDVRTTGASLRAAARVLRKWLSGVEEPNDAASGEAGSAIPRVWACIIAAADPD